MKLAVSRSRASRPSAVGSPLAADQLTVPAEQGLGAGQQRLPIRARQGTADRSQNKTVGGLPARSADLPLQHTELVAERQDLSLEPGLGPVADDEDLQQQTDSGVEEGEEHVGGDRRLSPAQVAGGRGSPETSRRRGG